VRKRAERDGRGECGERDIVDSEARKAYLSRKEYGKSEWVIISPTKNIAG
jgi:hypothetical protein